MVADDGDDVEIWSPGDGNDIADGNDGIDTLIVGPVLTNNDRRLRLDTWTFNRAIPKVDIAGYRPDCELVPVPDSEHLGVQYLLRFTAGHVASTRCGSRTWRPWSAPAPTPARPGSPTSPPAGRPSPPSRVSAVPGLAGAIVAPLHPHTRPAYPAAHLEVLMSGTVDRALVIGSSIAGLLAAQALSEAYKRSSSSTATSFRTARFRVGASPKSDTPTGCWPEAARRWRAAAGPHRRPRHCRGHVGDAQESGHYYVGTGRYATGTSGLTAVAVSRVLLEWTIRRRVAERRGRVLRPQLGPRPDVQRGRSAGHRPGRVQRGPAGQPAPAGGGPGRGRLRSHLADTGMAGTQGVPATRGGAGPLRHQLRHPPVPAASRRRGDGARDPPAGQRGHPPVGRPHRPGERRVDRRGHGVPRHSASDGAVRVHRVCADARGAGHGQHPRAARTPRRRVHLPVPGQRAAPVRATARRPGRDPRHRGRSLLVRPGLRPGNEHGRARGRRATGGLAEGREDLGLASSTARRSTSTRRGRSS